MRIDRAGIPFLVGSLGPAAVLALVRRPAWAAPFVLLAAFFGFFFRDPERRSPTDPALVVAPADGRVLVAGHARDDGAPPGDWLQVSIFLSPLDVHVNRSPVAGRVARVDYRPGRFLPAYRAEAATANERTEIWIDHRAGRVVCRQVVGVLARRIVCRTAVGDALRAGDRIGLMKFGSRMDVYLPVSAQVLVRVGQTVRAGETVIASLSAAG